jgi:hypothetical protein
VSKPGLEPTTHPQAGRPAKVWLQKKVCCNHPKLVVARFASHENAKGHDSDYRNLIVCCRIRTYIRRLLRLM